VVDSGIQVFLVENDIFGWDCLEATCFQEKGSGRKNKDWETRLHGGRRY